MYNTCCFTCNTYWRYALVLALTCVKFVNLILTFKLYVMSYHTWLWHMVFSIGRKSLILCRQAPRGYVGCEHSALIVFIPRVVQEYDCAIHNINWVDQLRLLVLFELVWTLARSYFWSLSIFKHYVIILCMLLSLLIGSNICAPVS